MIEAFAAFLMLAVLSDQGKAQEQTQQMLKRALLESKRWSFSVLFRASWLGSNAVPVANKIGHLAPDIYRGPYEDAEDAVDDLVAMIKAGLGKHIGSAAAEFELEHMMNALGLYPARHDWRDGANGVFRFIKGWHLEEVHRESPYYVGVHISVDIPYPVPNDPIEWMVKQIHRLQGSANDLGETILHDSYLPGDFVVLDFDSTGSTQPHPLLTDTDIDKLEARELLDTLPGGDTWYSEDSLFHRMAWDDMLDEADGELIEHDTRNV